MTEPLFEPPRKDFPRCPRAECGHGWHGLPCAISTCDCETSCAKPIIPTPTTQEDA